MTIEIRAVPAAWSHPTYPDGRPMSRIPKDRLEQLQVRWDELAEAWAKGFLPSADGTGWDRVDDETVATVPFDLTLYGRRPDVDQQMPDVGGATYRFMVYDARSHVPVTLIQFDDALLAQEWVECHHFSSSMDQ